MLPIQEYLKYNNIALIDPEQEFHQNCINQYANKGYLSIKQLDKLRNWCHSSEAIVRLINKSESVPSSSPASNLTPFDPEFVPATSKAETPTTTTTRARWSKADINILKDMLANHATIKELKSTFPDRTEASIKTKSHLLGAAFRKDKVVYFKEK